MAMDILEAISKRFPWIIVGYTDELNRMYNKNLPGFLDLRYNKTEHIEMEAAPAQTFTPYDPFA